MWNTAVQETSSILIHHTMELAWGEKCYTYIPNYRCWKPESLPDNTLLHLSEVHEESYGTITFLWTTILFVLPSTINPPNNAITSPTAWLPFWGRKKPLSFQQPWREDTFLVSFPRNCKNKFQYPQHIAREPTDCLSLGNLAWRYLGNPLLRVRLLKSLSGKRIFKRIGTSDASRI